MASYEFVSIPTPRSVESCFASDKPQGVSEQLFVDSICNRLKKYVEVVAKGDQSDYYTSDEETVPIKTLMT